MTFLNLINGKLSVNSYRVGNTLKTTQAAILRKYNNGEVQENLSAIIEDVAQLEKNITLTEIDRRVIKAHF